MAEEQQNGLEETLQAGASMAHVVKAPSRQERRSPMLRKAWPLAALMGLWQAHCGREGNRLERRLLF